MADNGGDGATPAALPLDALGALLTHVDEALVCCDEAGAITFASPGLRTLLGYDPTAVVGRSLLDFIHPDEAAEVLDALSRWSGRPGTPRGQVQRVRRPDGTWQRIRYDSVTGPAVASFGTYVLTLRAEEATDDEHRDLVQRLLNEDRLVRLASAFLHVPVEDFDAGLDAALSELSGLEWITRLSVWLAEGGRLTRRADWTAPTDGPALEHPEHLAIERFELTRRLAALEEVVLLRSVDGDEWALERALLDRAGVHGALAVPMASAGRFLGAILAETTFPGPAFDATHLTTLRSAAAILAGALVRNDAERRLLAQARIDPVTGLGSRWAFDLALDAALEALEAGDSPGIGLAIIDLDRFKLVNDAVGHTEGDRLLGDVAARFSGVAHPHTTLARLGGDELLVLHESCPGLDEAVERTAMLVRALVAPFEVADHAVVLTASAGVVHAGDASADATELLRRADLAMYRAKDWGGDRIEVDDEHQRERVAIRLNREAKLREAVAGEGIVPFFQGEWDLDSGALVGAEALARWEHPVEGRLEAAEFIPLAEECGLIHDLGLRILRVACTRLAEWRAQVPTDGFVLRVNLAAHQLRGEGPVRDVAAVLEETGLPPAALCLELTESSLLLDPERSVAMLEQLRELGVGLAVDDFGTGYSSMLYLKRLPVTSLKIDRAFVLGLPDDGRDRAIVRSTVQLAEALGISVTAEGVENPAQRDALVELGCTRAQGFLLGRPEPASTFVHRLATPAGI